MDRINGRKDKGRVGGEGSILVICKLFTFKSTQIVAKFSRVFFNLAFVVFFFGFFFLTQ